MSFDEIGELTLAQYQVYRRAPSIIERYNKMVELVEQGLVSAMDPEAVIIEDIGDLDAYMKAEAAKHGQVNKTR